MARVTPMIHVPDVAETVAWYTSVGFSLIDSNEDGGELDWAMLAFGDGAVMFNAGGRRSDAPRREVDLMVQVTEDVDRLHESLRDRVEVVEGPHDTFYRMREFVVRDLNGFWITFGRDLP